MCITVSGQGAYPVGQERQASTLGFAAGAIAIALAVFLAADLLAFAALAAVGRPSPAGALLIGVALALAACGGYTASAAARGRRGAWAATGVAAAALAIAIAASLSAARWFYDGTWDGLWYHQDAIHLLASGWNPLVEAPPDSHNGALWIAHYPKGPWILSAGLYQLTGAIEAGKASNGVLLLAAFAGALAVLSAAGARWFTSLALAALAAANPVALAQLFGFYVDGQLASAMTLLISLLALSYLRSSPWAMLGAACSVVYLINVKFTGLVYAALLCAAAAALWAARRRARARSLLVWLAVAGVVGVTAAGFNPYVRNLVEHGHPFHPICGEAPVDIMKGQIDPDFLALNRGEKLVRALLSRSSKSAEPPRLKVPFTVSRAERMDFAVSDVRAGGFGPWFGGALILAMALAALLLLRGALWSAAGFVIAVLIGTALANPECWWARYAPQLWLVPVALAALALDSKRRPERALAAAVAVALAVDVAIVGVAYVGAQVRETRLLRGQLRKARAAAGDRVIPAEFEDLTSLRVRLEEAGLHVAEGPADAGCKQPLTIPGLTLPIRLCLDPPAAPQAEIDG